MIWRRIKKSTPEQEKDFQEQLAEEKLSLKDKLSMVLSAYLVLVLPALLVLVALSLLICWLFGIF